MRAVSALVITAAIPLAACSAAPTTDVEPATETGALVAADAASSGLVRKAIPTEDPGPPFYARVTTILSQFFHDDGWLAIPFYRAPSCVPDGFNMLDLFDFPTGPTDPGAFACPLLMDGFLLTEPDAPPTRFPRLVEMTGDAVPFWFVRWTDFRDAMQDGVVTMEELASLEPLKGTAARYHETLRPREGDHTIVIDAAGTLDDGRRFRVHVTHIENETRAVSVSIR